jgi:hypothetical protein
MAAHLVKQVIPWVATRQWMVSVPIPLRYWMAASTELRAQVCPLAPTLGLPTCPEPFNAA